jgi:archaellum component FlaF (FlaF/FlaG flagellin family)
MKKKITAVVCAIIIVIFLVIGFFLYKDDNNVNGKIYASKETLCRQFAQSYLRTVQITDNAHSSENATSQETQRWQMAVDVETDFYNLCTLNLEENSLKMYKSVVIDKYQRQ